MLDFAPKDTAADHPWVKSNPDYYMPGGDEQIGFAPQCYMRTETDQGRCRLRAETAPTGNAR